MASVAACYVAHGEPELLVESIRSVKPYVDRVIIVDGLFHGNPGDDVNERIQQKIVADAICEAPPARPLEYYDMGFEPVSELEARSTYLQLLEADEWGLVIDSDELLIGDHPRAHALFNALRDGADASDLYPIMRAALVPIYTVAVNIPKYAPDISEAEYVTAPLLSTRGFQPRLFRNSSKLTYRLPPGAITPALALVDGGLLGADFRVEHGEFLILNYHVRQSLSSYQRDYAWETMGFAT